MSFFLLYEDLFKGIKSILDSRIQHLVGSLIEIIDTDLNFGKGMDD